VNVAVGDAGLPFATAVIVLVVEYVGGCLK
jgi:hypothetical protein